jgi:hypothetical protein
MKRKIIGILIFVLLILATTLPVTGSVIKINRQKLSKNGILDDLNIDIAITDAFSNKVRILLGDGSGGFTTSGSFSVEDFPLGITGGDFNGDGILDLITTSYNNHNVTVLLGDGNGDFSYKGSFPAGLYPVGIIDDDFNKDGNQDIAVANNDENYITVLLGNGTGNFTTQSQYTVGNSPVDLTGGKFNADNTCDLVVINLFDNSVSLLLGDGTGGFVLSDTSYLKINFKPMAITNKDFNKDGALDVAVASGGFPLVGILFGDGSGGFSTPQYHTVGNGSERFDIISADFNNDENPDIAVPNTDDNSVSVLFGNGTGEFETHQMFPVGSYPVGICDGDFNADGNRDLAVTNTNDNTVGILLGNGSGGFGIQQTYPAGDGPVGIISGNINYIPVPNLECQDSLNWTKIKPGATVYGEFKIYNSGDSDSKLNWKVSEYPSGWGSNWTFTPDNGTGLTPEAGFAIVNMSIETPDEAKTKFHGKIKVINLDDPSDYCEVDIYLQTPKSKSIYQALFSRIFERFPNASSFIKNLIKFICIFSTN